MIDKKSDNMPEPYDVMMLDYMKSDEFNNDMKKSIDLEYGMNHNVTKRSHCNE